MKEYIVTGEAMIVGGTVKGELIRCKDCVHYRPGRLFGCTLYNHVKDGEWFCADGERKEGDAKDG